MGARAEHRILGPQVGLDTKHLRKPQPEGRVWHVLDGAFRVFRAVRIPIKDCLYKGEHPNCRVARVFRGFWGLLGGSFVFKGFLGGF